MNEMLVIGSFLIAFSLFAALVFSLQCFSQDKEQ